MNMEYIRQYYSVPAKRGGRVRFLNLEGKYLDGTILSADNGRLNVHMDGDKHAGSYHPTWQLEYI